MTAKTIRRIFMKLITTLVVIFPLLLLPAFAQTEKGTGNLEKFVPAGYRIFEEIRGDLNKDGLNDYVLIIKGTDSNNVVDDKYALNINKKRDKNRRGIIIVFNWGNRYEIALENRDCFSSEMALPPHLDVEIKNGNLYIDYDLGSNFGYRSYVFRYRNSDFELIGYDVTKSSGIVVYWTRSVNFLTKKMKTERRKNTIDDKYDDNGVFEETWENITQKEPIKLQKIVDFDDFDDRLSDRFSIKE